MWMPLSTGKEPEAAGRTRPSNRTALSAGSTFRTIVPVREDRISSNRRTILGVLATAKGHSGRSSIKRVQSRRARSVFPRLNAQAPLSSRARSSKASSEGWRRPPPAPTASASR